MFAIIGAAGNVGYSTSKALRDAGVPVRAILHDAAKAARLSEIGCEISVADLQDSAALASAIGDADAVQVILPLRPQAADPAEDMCRSAESTVAALTQTRTKQVLAISDYGAHVADDIGMPSVFHEFEAGLRGLQSHILILRSAEHMHNWARGIPDAIQSGVLPSFQDPVDMEQPTISARDLGVIAANLLLLPEWEKPLSIIHAEGPRRYSAADVATALSELSCKTVRARPVPRSQWEGIFAKGMSASLADLLIKSNDAKNKGGLVDVEPNAGEVRHGPTELVDALRPFIPKA
ncbi:uncharacterized protein YbjT (DUF2867 family) [Neorhizobium galegae]|uniref:NAD(P)H-binding protein n=1 Tax=Neorhizobium galegae TaxID=399 RepID=UPI001AE310F1|nr:NAD(P)H-binding protein [Neorhizobium galegae]MBP2561929.1 uncharacterized protein YbjT (DUF2867 family) [Neorhizobium galegae]